MQKNILALIISMSTIAMAPQLYAKEISYGNQKIVLSDNIASGDDFYRYVNQD